LLAPGRGLRYAAASWRTTASAVAARSRAERRMASLEIRGGRRRRVFQILDAEFSVGAGPDDALRIAEAGIAAGELQIVAVGAGHRVTAADGATLVVNGRPSGPRLLLHGDRIRLGGVELVYC